MVFTFAETMLRAAEIIAQITQDQLEQYRQQLVARGCPLERAARVDRADLAGTYFRMIGEEKMKEVEAMAEGLNT